MKNSTNLINLSNQKQLPQVIFAVKTLNAIDNLFSAIEREKAPKGRVRIYKECSYKRNMDHIKVHEVSSSKAIVNVRNNRIIVNRRNLLTTASEGVVNVVTLDSFEKIN